MAELNRGYTDESGRVWYSKRTYIHAQQTTKRAAAKRQQKEIERLRRLGVDRLGTD